MLLFRNKPDDYYITFLKYAREKIREQAPIEFSDVFNYVHTKNPEVEELPFKRTYLGAMETVSHLGRAPHEDDITSGTPMVLKMEAYFHLLEHEELQDARKASRNAMYIALAAILLGAISTSAQIADKAGWI